VFLAANEEAAKNRKTQATFKNDTSSRSHAVCKIRLRNTHFKSMDDGELYLIDLAGSENTADL
jgi:kinesin family protein 2/24